MKALLIIALVVVVGGGGWWIYQQNGNGAGDEVVETVTVEARDIEKRIKITGEIAPSVETEIRSEINGRVAAVYVASGDAVEAGDVLVELDPSELRTEFSAAERRVETARLRLEKVERQYNRQKDLHEQEFIPQREFDDAQTDLELARNEMEIAADQLETIEERMNKTVIRAPHDGIIINKAVSVGEVIAGASGFNQGTILMAVADLTELVVLTEINEIDVARIRLGMAAELVFDAIQDYTVNGEVVKIAPSASVDENVRVFPIQIVFMTDNEGIRPGMSARVEFVPESVTGAPSVPLATVFTEEEERFVFVTAGENRFRRQVVEVGINDTRFVEIREGLTLHDTIARTRPAEELVENPDGEESTETTVAVSAAP